MKTLSRVIRALAGMFYNAMFGGHDTWTRHVPTVMLLIEVVLVYYLLKFGGVWGFVAAFFPLIILHILSRSLRSMIYMLIVTSIPAIWYFFTSLPFTRSIEISLVGSLKAMSLGLWLLTTIFYFNPMEVSYLIYKLTKKTGLSLYLPLTWKMIPHTMRDLENALLVNELKGESSWVPLAVTLLTTREYEKLYIEGLWTKMSLFKPHFWYDKEAVILHSLLIAFLILHLLIFLNLI